MLKQPIILIWTSKNRMLVPEVPYIFLIKLT
nr:MAG TPA: hypothetical protein [Bacteriophage sp.]